MNRTVFALCVAIAALAPAYGQTAGDSPVVAQTLFSDGRTNTWTQADLIAALQLVNRKYHRDCESPGGRNAWHGKLVGQTVSTNGTTLVKTEQHEDGAVFRFEALFATVCIRLPGVTERTLARANSACWAGGAWPTGSAWKGRWTIWRSSIIPWKDCL